VYQLLPLFLAKKNTFHSLVYHLAWQDRPDIIASSAIIPTLICGHIHPPSYLPVTQDIAQLYSHLHMQVADAHARGGA
jgi:hypothetical protein